MTAPDGSTERLDESDLRTLARIWPFARPDGWAMAVALLLTPVVAALNLAQPWLLKEAIDRHIVPAEVEGLREVGLLYLAAVVGGYASVAVYSMLLAWSGQRTILRLRSALYAHVASAAPAALRCRSGIGRLRALPSPDLIGVTDA